MNIDTWINKTQKLFDQFPKGYWLYAVGGSLCVMRYDTDGIRIMIGDGFDSNAIVGELTVPPSGEIDGGDW